MRAVSERSLPARSTTGLARGGFTSATTEQAASPPRLPARSTTGLARGGFTLLEVLVTVALVVIVLGLSGGALISSLRATPRTQLRAREEIELLRITGVLQRQVQSTARSLQGNTSLSGQSGEKPHTDSLTLLTPNLLHHSGVGLAEWSILQEEDAPPYLAYRETPYDGGQSIGSDPRYPFSTMIRGLDVRYLSAPDYVKGWQRPEPPERVRITLWYPVEDGQASTTFETVVGLSQVPSPVPEGGLDIVDNTLRARPSGQPSTGPSNAAPPAPSERQRTLSPPAPPSRGLQL